MDIIRITFVSGNFPQMQITDELVKHVHRVLFSAENKNLGMLATVTPNDSLKYVH